MRLLLTNALSLRPKIGSLKEAFDSLGLNVACITESWCRGGAELRDFLLEVEGKTGLKIHHKSRDGRKKKTGGGVAIVFDSGTCNFKNRTLKHVPKEAEVMCIAGKVARRVVIFAVYVPPVTSVPVWESTREAIAVEVGVALKAYKNPIVMVTGDFNHRDMMGALNEVGSFAAIPTGPTRGLNTIDIIHSNVPEAHGETLVLPPLQASDGTPSDHRCVYTEVEFPPERGYTWEVKMRRTRDAARERAFANDMSCQDWDSMLHSRDVDEMTATFEAKVGALTERHFPLARTRKRSTEPPWITKRIKCLWKKKLRIYKRKGKNTAWLNTDHALQEAITEARTGFVDRILEDGNSGRSFYTAVRKLASPSSQSQWAVTDLYPGLPTAKVCHEILEFYGKIAMAPSRPIPPAPEFRSGGLGHFSEERTVSLLSAMKKTESRVDGDPLSNLVREYPSAFAAPVTAIYNAVNLTGKWPARWKTEHLTIIPKVPNPSGLSECRNISCTSVFSKILEGVVLQQLRTELDPDRCQYGGTPKCGAEHMLVDMWEKILEALDGGQNAAVLLGVDYEKAFNRMDHAVCLDRLKRLGASDDSIALVRAFLEGRTMTVKVDGHTAEPIAISRGIPQGSVLGCLLHCVATQLQTCDLRASQRLVNFFPQDDNTDTGIEFWERNDSCSFLYVDDTTILDSVPLNEAERHITTGTTVEEFRQLAVAGDFDELSRRAEDIGMAINGKKTQLLVISPPNGCLTSASIATADSLDIKSVEKLKLVGFTFGSSPGAEAHVEALCDKYKRKKWLLHHLWEAGIREEQLYKLYCCYIRSIFEYCTPVYHPLLNKRQEQALERLQRHALRVCFGADRPVEEWMEQYSISTLKNRRIRKCDSFIRKAAANPRFGPAWFPPRGEQSMSLRSRREIQETQATTARRFNSPLVFLRRRANAIGVIPEAWGL